MNIKGSGDHFSPGRVIVWSKCVPRAIKQATDKNVRSFNLGVILICYFWVGSHCATTNGVLFLYKYRHLYSPATAVDE